MQYGIRLEQAIEKVGEHFSVVAWEQQPQCVGRARSQAVPSKAHHLTLVGQIMGPIVQIVIQAPYLARMFFGGYWSNLPDGPLENPRWLPFFSRWLPFSLFKIIF